MRLSDALDELQGNILRDISDIKSGPGDSFWKQQQLVRYINEGQRRFARFSYCLRDATTPQVVRVVMRPGINTYILHPSIFFVITARPANVAYDLKRIHHGQFTSATNELWFDSAQLPNSQPLAFSTDEEIALTRGFAVSMMVTPTPSALEDGLVVNLRVARTPLQHLRIEDMDAHLELPDDYQLDMLEWPAWRALRNWDIDAEDRKKAKEHRDRFDEAVFEARHETMNKAFAPVTWLFGQAGYSYTGGRGY